MPETYYLKYIKKMTYTIQELRDRNLIIFEAISGSHAYGTNIPESDVDTRGIFMQPLEDALKYGYVEQVSDETNDTTFYELGRFIHLLTQNNPNIVELLSVPKDCIIYRDPIFDMIESNKEKFLTKKVRWTFAGYAIDQIQKARGYNKKMNMEEADMKRKTVLDFCYVIYDNGSMPFLQWVDHASYTTTWGLKHMTQENFGLAKIDHTRDMYALYFNNKPEWGISSGEKANDVMLTSIPKDVYPVGYLSFNKDGYSSHCIKYKEYQTWLSERNPHRVKMNKAHGKQYDSKNMMHCMRLLDMVVEMLDTCQINVRRPKAHIEYLMQIRRGEMEYEEILRIAEEKIATLDQKCSESKLPKEVDTEFALSLLLEMRKTKYKL